MISEGQAGPRIIADGGYSELRLSRDATLIVGDGHARFREAVARGNCYLAANQSGSAVTNLNSTATGLILSNPAGSGVNLDLWEIGFAATAAPGAATTLQLAANVNPLAAATTHTSALVVRNCLLGGPTRSAAFADSSATLPASPVAILNLASPALAASEITPPTMVFDVSGKVIVGPGCTISLSALAAVTGVAHFIWEEVLA